MIFLCIVKFCLQLIPLSQGELFLMINALEIMHKLIFTIPSVKLAQLTQFDIDLI